MKCNLKLLCIILLLFYLIFIVYITIQNKKTEKFTNIFEALNDSIEKNKKHQYPITSYEEDDPPINRKKINIIKKDIKYIYLLKIKDYSYNMYNHNLKKYMNITINFNKYINDILLEDLNHKIVGKFISEKYNNIIIYLDFYKKNCIFEYLKNFKELKFYLENDDKYFYIKKDKDNNYVIYLFELLIGKITNNNNNKKLYKIMCYQEYKTYLNLFGLSFILLSIN